MAEILEIKSPDILPLLEKYSGLRPAAVGARGSALASTGFIISRALSEWVASGGQGGWAPLHPVTMRWQKKFRAATGVFSPRLIRGNPKPFGILAQFSRYRVSPRAVSIGFGAKFPLDRPAISKIALQAESGLKTRVSPKMRRLFAALGNPIRSRTRTLEAKPRPIAPFFPKMEGEIFPHFESRFVAALGRRSALADSDFRKGRGVEKS